MNRDDSGAGRRILTRLTDSQRKFLAHLARGHAPECFEHQEAMPLVVDMIRFGVRPGIESADSVRVLRECPVCYETVVEASRSLGAEVPGWWTGRPEEPPFLERVRQRLQDWFETTKGQMEFVQAVLVPVPRAGFGAEGPPHDETVPLLAPGDEFSLVLRGGLNGNWVWVWLVQPPPPEGTGTANVLYPPQLRSGFAPSRIAPGEAVAMPLTIQPGTAPGRRVLIGLFSSSVDLDARFATRTSECRTTENLWRLLQSVAETNDTGIRVEVTELEVLG